MKRTTAWEYMTAAEEAAARAAGEFAAEDDAFVERLLEMTRGVHKAEALEMGTGAGALALRLTTLRPDWHITAVDAATSSLAAARQAAEAAALGGRVDWVLADLWDTKLPNTPFDVIFSQNALHQCPRPAGFWQEVRRLARHGTTVYVRDLTRPDDERAAREAATRYAGGMSQALRDDYYEAMMSACRPGEIVVQLAQARLDSLETVVAPDGHVEVFGQVA